MTQEGCLVGFPKKQNPHKKMGKERELIIYHYDPSGLLGWFPKKTKPSNGKGKREGVPKRRFMIMMMIMMMMTSLMMECLV
jgi:hypothetical protein